MAATTTYYSLHNLFRSKTTFLSLLRTTSSTSLSLLRKPCFSLSLNSLSPTSFQALAIENPHLNHTYEDEIEDESVTNELLGEPRARVEDDEIEAEEEETVVTVKPVVSAELLPSLSMKEKKELSSYAHGLGDKLKSQLVGKSGVTDSVAASFVENLESNELLKIKIHRTCPGELIDVVKHLQQATTSVVISQIGRTVILYKPSLTKLKAEEKKMQNRKVFVRKSFTLKPTLPSRKNAPILPRLSGRGHRGGNRI